MTGNEKAMETLMEQGRAHGKLTTTEINDVMEKLDLDVDQIDSFYDNCQSMNIDIIEDFDAESELALSDLNLQDDLGMALSTEGIAIDDPVKTLPQGNRQSSSSYPRGGDTACRAYGKGRCKGKAETCGSKPATCCIHRKEICGQRNAVP